MITIETAAPWITYHYRTSDRWTRITGRSMILARCSYCYAEKLITLRIPRFGPVPSPAGGRHPERIAWVEEHGHGRLAEDWQATP